MATCTELAARLAEAETAKHALLTGQQTAMQRQADKQLQLTPSDPAKLDLYIRGIRAEMQRKRCPGCTRDRMVIRTVALDPNSHGC